MPNSCVIFNPGSGSADESEEFEQRVDSLAGLDFCQTAQDGDAADLAETAAHEGREIVVAAGGDGTVSQVVTGLMRAREAGVTSLPALLIAPFGTGNDLARTFEQPPEPLESLNLIETAPRRPLDVMKWRLVTAEGEKSGWAVNVLAGGFSSQLQASLTPEIKKTWGPLAYVRAAVGTASELEPFELTFSVDDGPRQTMSVLNAIVANARFAGGGIAVAPHADPGDGLLDLVIISAGEGLQLAGLAVDLVSGDVLTNELVVNVRGAKFHLESTPPMPFNVDGDKAGEGTLEVEVIAGALQIIAPPSGDEGEI